TPPLAVVVPPPTIDPPVQVSSPLRVSGPAPVRVPPWPKAPPVAELVASTVIEPALVNGEAKAKVRPPSTWKLPAALFVAKPLIAARVEVAVLRITVAPLAVTARPPKLRVPLASTW